MLLLAPASAAGYLREAYNDDGPLLYAAGLTMRITIDTSRAPADLPAADVDAAIRAGVAAWQGLVCDGQPVPVTLSDDAADVTGIIEWIDDSGRWPWGDFANGNTEVTADPATGAISGFIIQLNGDGHRWSPNGAADTYDVQNAVAHEFGHVFGLDHTDVSTATMNEVGPLGETSKRELDPDDIAGFCEIYGPEKTEPPPTAPDSDPGCAAVRSGGSPITVWLVLLMMLLIARSGRRRSRTAHRTGPARP